MCLKLWEAIQKSERKCVIRKFGKELMALPVAICIGIVRIAYLEYVLLDFVCEYDRPIVRHVRSCNCLIAAIL